MLKNESIMLWWWNKYNSDDCRVGRKNIHPDLIIMADTGAERPHTYAHIEIMQEFLRMIEFPKITIVKKVDKNGEVLTLEDDLIKTKHCRLLHTDLRLVRRNTKHNQSISS